MSGSTELSARSPVKILVVALLTIKRHRKPTLAISEIVKLPWNDVDWLNTTSAKSCGNGYPMAITAIYIPEIGKFVSGSTIPKLHPAIQQLPMRGNGPTMRYCEYLRRIRQSRFADEEQLVVNALVNGMLQFRE